MHSAMRDCNFFDSHTRFPNKNVFAVKYLAYRDQAYDEQ
jgi:hypothetical protein